MTGVDVYEWQRLISRLMEALKSAVAGLLVWWLAMQSVCCHAFPDRPLTLVVPFPATGSADISGAPRISKLVKMMQTLSTPSLPDSLAQQVSYALTGALGQPVNLERRPSGKTIAGTRYAASAAPDGYTLLLAGSPTITIYPSLYPRLPYNPVTELAPVAALARMPIALITAGDNPAKTVTHVIERARFVPGQVNYAAVGDGSTSHLTGELFGAMGGIAIVHVNYNGSGPAINAVATRNVEFGFVPLTAVLPYLDGGKIRIIAVTSAARHPAIPQTPTVAEAGVAGFDAEGWFGVFAPARTSSAIVSLLNHQLNVGFGEAVAQRMLISQGLSPAPGSAQDFRTLIEKDRDQWSRLLKTTPVFLKPL